MLLLLLLLRLLLLRLLLLPARRGVGVELRWQQRYPAIGSGVNRGEQWR